MKIKTYAYYQVEEGEFGFIRLPLLIIDGFAMPNYDQKREDFNFMWLFAIRKPTDVKVLNLKAGHPDYKKGWGAINIGGQLAYVPINLEFRKLQLRQWLIALGGVAIISGAFKLSLSHVVIAVAALLAKWAWMLLLYLLR